MIFAGDLNIRDSEIGLLPQNIYDLWIKMGRNRDSEYTWDCDKNANKKFPDPPQPRLRFDRVFVRESLKRDIIPKSFKFIGTRKVKGIPMHPSDHFGIFATFQRINLE